MEKPERDGPDLLQGGGEALMFGGPVGDWPMNEPCRLCGSFALGLVDSSFLGQRNASFHYPWLS